MAEKTQAEEALLSAIISGQDGMFDELKRAVLRERTSEEDVEAFRAYIRDREILRKRIRPVIDRLPAEVCAQLEREFREKKDA